MFVRIVLCAFFMAFFNLQLPCFSKVNFMSIQTSVPGLQVLQCGNVKFEMNVPQGYKLGVLRLGARTTYMFMGPDDKNQKHAVLSVDVLPLSEKTKSSRAVIEGVFSAYGKGSPDFKSAMMPPLTVDGRVFERGSFGGSIDGDQSKGFAAVGRMKNAVCVMVARDFASDFKKSEGIMLGIVKSCKIKAE